MLLTLPELIKDARQKLTCLTAQEYHITDTTVEAITIDVREPNEHAQKSIPQSINIPRGILEMQMLAKYPDENLSIYIHCATGGRACLAAEQLLRVGYKNVFVIADSIDNLCVSTA